MLLYADKYAEISALISSTDVLILPRSLISFTSKAAFRVTDEELLVMMRAVAQFRHGLQGGQNNPHIAALK
jgi:hypothetical protein